MRDSDFEQFVADSLECLSEDPQIEVLTFSQQTKDGYRRLSYGVTVTIGSEQFDLTITRQK
jgi:hypothetical protein